jgi:hypothetical protein
MRPKERDGWERDDDEGHEEGRMRKRPFSRDEERMVRRLLARGVTWEVIGRQFGLTAEGVRRRIDVAYREKRNMAARLSHAARGDADSSDGVARHRVESRAGAPPPEVLREWAARLAAPRSLGATILGDPPQGFSALEKR